MKVREDPRTNTDGYNWDYKEVEVDEDEDEDEDEHEDDDYEERDIGYVSEGSSGESHQCSSIRGKLRSSVKRLVMGENGSGSGSGSGRNGKMKKK